MIQASDVVFVVMFVIGFIQGMPSWSLNLPTIGSFRPFGSQEPPAEIKHYSGRRVKNDSIRMVYFHDQTVAIVELERDKMLLNCELIEVL